MARMFPPKFLPKRDMPDLSRKITLVIGGNTGIGYETIKQLLLKDAKVYLAARSPVKAAAAIKRLEQETNKLAIFLQLDLADLRSVRKAAGMFLAQESRLDIVQQCASFKFGTNVIGHFFLTELLVSALTKSYEKTKVPARVIHTSSAGHEFGLKGGPERDAWVKNTGGFIAPWHTAGWMRAPTNSVLYPAPMGAYTQLWGATVATPAQITGQYLLSWGRSERRTSVYQVRS
ncbi:NAD-P-binding protein [Mycena vulgaris]|nr:NAD-P-binding protein [Mycena vulgaris]